MIWGTVKHVTSHCDGMWICAFGCFYFAFNNNNNLINGLLDSVESDVWVLHSQQQLWYKLAALAKGYTEFTMFEA